jgi:hypothetical protein
MFQKLFGLGKKKEADRSEPNIPFGRYSDNNKPVVKVNRWSEADNLFKEKKYHESIDAFFEYLRDDQANNVVYERNGMEGRFQLFQGSKIVRGTFDQDHVKAEVTLAKMPSPSIPVMRRLLEMNFTLYYNRFALDEDRVCMRFDSDIHGANPSKLYYGLKELSIKADKQDDLLVQDFAMLVSTDNEHVIPIEAAEKEIKYEYFKKWIQQTLDMISTLDADKFSGGIAYMMLSLIYRIDYLVSPEGKLLNELEKIAAIYFKKDERPVTEKNRDMAEEFRKLQLKEKDEIISYLFRSRYTFSIVAPQPYKIVSESIHTTNLNTLWYRDNNYPYIANQIIEYGIAYCQYSYSLPKAITELFHLYMMVNYAEYFSALGFKTSYYNAQTNEFASQAIISQIKLVQDKWKEKYPLMNFIVQNLRFDTLTNFNHTFTTELELLNMEGK